MKIRVFYLRIVCYCELFQGKLDVKTVMFLKTYFNAAAEVKRYGMKLICFVFTAYISQRMSISHLIMSYISFCQLLYETKLTLSSHKLVLKKIKFIKHIAAVTLCLKRDANVCVNGF